MKKFGKFYRNPGPAFALTLANPAGKKKSRRNPAKRKKNPVRKAAAVPAPMPRAVAKKSPPKKTRRRKKAVVKFSPPVVTQNPSPMKTKRSRKRRNPGRKSSRGRSRSRNPGSRRRSRNPGSRRRSIRRRNPGGGFTESLKDTMSINNIAVGAGVLGGIVGTKYAINTILTGDATGKRMFDLPGITYPTAAQPMTAVQFNTVNKVALAFYESAIPWAIGYALRKQAPRFSEGLTISAVVNLGIAVLKGTTIGQKAGVGAFLPRGTGTYIPGVPPILAGPATAFINNGSPVGRRRSGTGALVNDRWMNQTTANGASPFMPS